MAKELEPKNNCIVGFDLTIASGGENGWDRDEVFQFLKEWAKKWVFQEEVGSTSGYRHFQVRLHLFVKRRLNEIISMTKDVLPHHHWSVTTRDVHLGQNFNYVMKADTRVEGPWTDKDDCPPPMTRQLQEFMRKEWHPWQHSCLAFCEEHDDRAIKIIYDRKGDSGKSVFVEYLEYHNKAYEIPPFRLLEDIMAVVMAVKVRNAYCIDMPRALKKDKLAEFYSGLECLKNGVAFDKRYSFKKMRFSRPQVIVFTNTLPVWSFMSADRWEVYEMDEFKALRRHSFEIPQDPLA